MDWVFSKLNKEMFEALQPPNFVAKIKSYGGEQVGDTVCVCLKGIRQEMKVRISERQLSENHCYFVDIGEVLPLGLSAWQHKHHVYKNGENQSILSDEIFLDHPSIVGRYLSFAVVKLFLVLRSFQYRIYFKKSWKSNK